MKEVLLPLVYAVATLAGCVWLGGWLGRLLRHALDRLRVDPLVASLLVRLVRPLAVVIGLTAALKLLGLDGASTGLAAMLGGASVALGLGLKGYLSDVAAGTFLLTNRPFDRGDLVSVGGQTGVVVDLGLFTTRLDLADGNTAFVPNSRVTAAPILNFTDRGSRRLQVEVELPREADLDAAMATARGVLELPGVLSEPAPSVALSQVGGATSRLSIQVWADNADHDAVQTALNSAVHRAFAREAR